MEGCEGSLPGFLGRIMGVLWLFRVARWGFRQCMGVVWRVLRVISWGISEGIEVYVEGCDGSRLGFQAGLWG